MIIQIYDLYGCDNYNHRAVQLRNVGTECNQEMSLAETKVTCSAGRNDMIEHVSGFSV